MHLKQLLICGWAKHGLCHTVLVQIIWIECEKYADISQKTKSDNDIAYSFDMVTNNGTSIRTQTYILFEKDKKRASELDTEINKVLSGNSDIEIYTLLGNPK